MIAAPPVRTEFEQSNGWVPNLPWLKWFQSITAAFTIAFGVITGAGDGAAVGITARAQGSGSGPANPSTVVTWAQVTVGSETYWTPLFK